MNWDRIESGWKDLKASARQQWGKLSEEQLSEISGKRDSLSEKVRVAYGIHAEEAEKQISDWQARQQETSITTQM